MGSNIQGRATHKTQPNYKKRPERQILEGHRQNFNLRNAKGAKSRGESNSAYSAPLRLRGEKAV